MPIGFQSFLRDHGIFGEDRKFEEAVPHIGDLCACRGQASFYGPANREPAFILLVEIQCGRADREEFGKPFYRVFEKFSVFDRLIDRTVGQAQQHWPPPGALQQWLLHRLIGVRESVAEQRSGLVEAHDVHGHVGGTAEQVTVTGGHEQPRGSGDVAT